MQSIVLKHAIAAASDTVWAALLDPARCFHDIPDVRVLEIVENQDQRKLLKWSVWLKGFELPWQEEQQIDPARRRIEFAQSQGMFACYRGHWQIGASNGAGTEVELALEVETGMPHLGQFIDPVLADAYAEMGRQLLRGVERAALASTARDGRGVSGHGHEAGAVRSSV